MKKKKSKKPPLLLRTVRFLFPFLEKTAPFLATRLFAWCFFMPLRYRTPDREKEEEGSAQKIDVHIKRKRIQLYSWGKGPSVWFVHGWSGRATQFYKFIPAFIAQGYQVVGIDGPAHGRSDGRYTNILEFHEVFVEAKEKMGFPVAAVSHSFGGVALLYSITQGLPIGSLVTIGMPVIGQEIINTFLRAVSGSEKTSKNFNSYMLKKYGKPFEQFSVLHFVDQIEVLPHMLLVYDRNDWEVPFVHAEAIQKKCPKAELFQTKGLGHSGILRNEQIIDRTLQFIKKTS